MQQIVETEIEKTIIAEAKRRRKEKTKEEEEKKQNNGYKESSREIEDLE